jgi:hypothetical protein
MITTPGQRPIVTERHITSAGKRQRERRKPVAKDAASLVKNDLETTVLLPWPAGHTMSGNDDRRTAIP